MNDTAPRPPQITISRLLLCTSMFGIFLAAAPFLYGKGQPGEIMSLLMVGIVLTFGGLGAIVSGLDSMFRGLVIGQLLVGVSTLAMLGVSLLTCGPF